jgi:ABC-type glutathione transport system ATPase component
MRRRRAHDHVPHHESRHALGPPTTRTHPHPCHASSLSQGGQAQRVALAVAVALQPSVLLVDEPTSACDLDSARRVEAVLKGCGAAVIWVTHDPGQPPRVGGRQLELPSGEVSEVELLEGDGEPPRPGSTDGSERSGRRPWWRR